MIKEKQETMQTLNEAQQVMQQQESEIKRLNEELYEEEELEELQSSIPPVQDQTNEQQRMSIIPGIENLSLLYLLQLQVHLYQYIKMLHQYIKEDL